MPKKTRQEKILAKLHRLEKGQVGPETDTNPTKLVPKISFEVASPTPNLNTQANTTNYDYVFADLKKSLIFAVVAVIFQILLATFVIK